MAEAEFNYEGLKIVIQCNENEMMKNICQSFLNKIKEDKNKYIFHIMEKQEINLMKI